jgi:hypothetical protein
MPFATRATALTMVSRGGQQAEALRAVRFGQPPRSFSVGKDLALDLPTNW